MQAMRDFLPFQMERWQSTYENVVDYNLSESGVHPLTLGELLALAGTRADDLALGYGQSNGSMALRQNIARLYTGASSDNVCVTNGSAEANFIALWTLADPGSEIAVVTPTYMQTPGLAHAMGANVREILLREELGWQPDARDVTHAVTGDTRLIIVTNPGNPTGTVLSAASRHALLSAAARAGAWILADEVYAGAEIDDVAPTRSFWGEYPRVVATGSLSKAYGLPGLRIGWIIAQPELTERLWARKDYTTISPGELSDALAALALDPAVRPRILERTRERLRHGWHIMEGWLREQGCFHWQRPDAGAICFARYDLPIDSRELAERLRVEQSVLIVPGAHFQREGFVRLGFGLPPSQLRAALARVSELLEGLLARTA
jgi:aspartate/methionine/tyrosine aminotransferase